MRDKLSEKIMIEFAALGSLTDDRDKNNNIKGTKNCAIKCKLKFEVRRSSR